MKKLWLIIAACIGIGVALAAAGYALGGSYSFYLNKLRLEPVDTVPKIIEQKDMQAFQDILVDADFSSIVVEQGETYGVNIRYAGRAPQLECKDGRLVVRIGGEEPMSMNRINIGWFGVNPNEYYVRVTVPAGVILKNINITNESGLVSVTDIDCRALKVTGEFGKIELRDINASDIEAYSESGSQTFEAVHATGVLACETEFGSATFRDISAAEMSVTMENGTLQISAATIGATQIESQFGSVGVDINGQSLYVACENGDIHIAGDITDSIEVKNEFGEVKFEAAAPVSAFSGEMNTEFGSVRVNGAKAGNHYALRGGSTALHINCENGSIEANFR